MALDATAVRDRVQLDRDHDNRRVMLLPGTVMRARHTLSFVGQAFARQG